jgi:hypothetical protein
MKKLTLFLISTLLCFTCAYGVLSTTTGGDWNDPDTWFMGILPGPGDDVQIQGPVNVNYACYCNNLIINYGATLQNVVSEVGSLFIGSTLYNSGQIRDNPSGGTLRLYVNSHITNGGFCGPEYIYLTGGADQNFTINEGAEMSPAHLVDQNNSSRLVLLTDLYLAGVASDFNNASIAMNGHILNLSDGYLQEANLQGGGGATLSLGNSAYIEYITADEIIFAGEVMVGPGVSVGILTNQSTLMNYPGAYRTLTVNTRLNNYLSIINHPSSHGLDLALYGDLYNYDAIYNRYIYMYGTGV